MVTSCVDGPEPGDTPVARQQFRLTGSGKLGEGTFTVSITRFASDTGVGGTTITETATVLSGTGDAAAGLEAKRTSIQGKWLDLNNPAVKTALLTRRGTLVEVDARFGPQGSIEGDPQIVVGRITARCPN